MLSSSMFAIIESGSKQYRVKTGDVIKVEKLKGEAVEVGSTFKFSKILALNGQIGDAVSGNVSAEILEHRKNVKEIIFKKKRRHNYRRKRGHRQEITVLRITEIGA